jgi:exonuclease III
MRHTHQKIARTSPKLSWADTARAMASEPEDWSAWDQTLSDGLDQIPWEPRPATRVADGG